MWGTPLWWIFPAIAVVMCLAMLVVMAFFCINKGCGCMQMRDRH